MSGPASCDIFCNVIDNYGDIGVSWRLARQLAHEYGLKVRLIVDDLASFAKLCPDADPELLVQRCRGVEVWLWSKAFPSDPSAVPARGTSGVSPQPCCDPSAVPARGTSGVSPQPCCDPSAVSARGASGVPPQLCCDPPADLVIDAFGCALPPGYLAAMTARTVWINLEYLSAEGWVEGCHRLPSPKPPLTRYFFFPGFTRNTGGLLIEQDLLARRDAFLADPALQQAFWRSVGIEMPSAGTLKISMFAYENAALAALFDEWAGGGQPVLCLVPEGRILPDVEHYFTDAMPVPRPLAGRRQGFEKHASCCQSRLAVQSRPWGEERGPGERAGYVRGNLTVRVLPFVPQECYDELLWACDVNFVRGEDSCVRAQWAGKPFVWQIYPQQDAVHWDKLQAFLDLYCATLSTDAKAALQRLWRAWNGEPAAGAFPWNGFAAMRAVLNPHAMAWAQELSQNNLALNLLDFSQEIGTMRAFEIDEQRT